jgi:hypothetical protein
MTYFLFQVLPEPGTTLHKLTPIRNYRKWHFLFWQQHPQLGVPPTQIVSSGIPVLPDPFPEFFDFFAEVFTAH